MASRVRIKNRVDGGEKCGQRDTGPAYTPGYLCSDICTDETHPGPPYRSGGPLTVRRKTVFIRRFPYFELTWNFGSGLYYKGYMSIQPYNASQPAPTNLSGWGAKAYARAIPTHPIYQLGVSIGELKDLPGLVRQLQHVWSALRKTPDAYARAFKSVADFLNAAKNIPKDSADLHLGAAFGVAPMLQDLFFLLEMREKLKQKIRWLRSHNGKTVHRKFNMRSLDWSEAIPQSLPRVSTVNPGLNTACYAPGYGTVQNFDVNHSYKSLIWFAGRFQFHVPELDVMGDGPLWGLKLHLLGLAPDISILYKLIPWTWLIDWFSSVGSILSNLYQNARYHVVARYAYIMCRETHKWESPGEITVYAGDFGDFIGRGAKYWTQHFVGSSFTKYDFRTREVANPYGFGITYPSLSAYQWSILVALGLSRGGKHSAPRS